MKIPCYQLKAEKSLMVFEFVSQGHKGNIIKLVKYSKTNLKDLYNLAFGDLDPESNDTTVSNNGDSDMVLATVVSTVYAFTDKHPNCWIYATGSTKARTRLYQMGIAKYMEEIQVDFDVYGERENEWEVFQKNVTYEAFLAKRKKT